MALIGDEHAYMCILQRAIGVTVDGIPGPQTLAACRTIQVGSTGDGVSTLQFFIGAAQDGILGPETKKVLEFQKRKHITQDGIVGHNTWRELLKPIAAEYGTSL